MHASEIIVNVLFYVFAIAAVAGAVGVAVSGNIVRSAFSLLALLFSVAALYALMKADFIAAAQVLIYVGGILVLIIFAVMLTHRITDVNVSNESTPGPAAFCAVLCLLFALVVIILPLPHPGPNKWDAGRGAEPWRDGPFTLGQYQADGKTGIASGGSTFEDEVVVSVTVPPDRRGGVLRVEVQAAGGEKLGGAPLDEGDTTYVRLSGLKETAYNWQLKLVGADGDLTPWMSPKGDPDFKVYKGVTEPIAWALANPYLLAFEAVSMLLLAALVGAAFLARKEVKE